jgi:formylglycine-generating enzyme required for sulfatase activity
MKDRLGFCFRRMRLGRAGWLIAFFLLATTVVVNADTMTLDLGGGVNMEFVLIPAGEFDMGQVGIAEPVHHVTISKSFYMGKYEVTQEQYQRIMGYIPYVNTGPTNPVQDDAITNYEAFCTNVSALTGLRVRLPTEAEWEYACRAGTATVCFWGNDPSGFGPYAVFEHGVPLPDGQRLPNPWGLYDMPGNVGEAIQDFYGPYSADPVSDPQGPAGTESGSPHVVRGGNAHVSATQGAQSAWREAQMSPTYYHLIGFRVAVDAAFAHTISITSPTNNSMFTAGDSITINATASDTNSTLTKVDFYQGSTKLGEDTSSPYSYTWNGVAGGAYSLTAKAIDNNSITTTSVAVSIIVYGFTYMTNSPDTNTITITGYSGPSGVVTIPSAIHGLSVTSIGAMAFYSCTNLTSVTIPSSVTDIGDSAFWGCSALVSVTVPDSVTNIGDGAFSRCTSLSNVTIGNNVTGIGDSAFWGCISMANVTIPGSVTNIGAYAFEDCSGLTSVTIPDSVTSIGNYAFEYCTRLTAITVDALNPVYSSLDGVLYDKGRTRLIQCPGGKAGSVAIPDSVTNIGDYAFCDCASLTNVTIGTGVTSIGDSAFTSCFGLTRVYFHGNAPIVGGQNVFFNDNGVTVYHLPGTTNWGTTFGGFPTALWIPLVSGDGSFGIQTNQFGFNINWASGMVFVVEACTNLADPVWSPVATNTLTGDSSYFGDHNWTNCPRRFYRLRSQ